MISEPFAIQDIYFEGVVVEQMKNGMIRFKLTKDTANGPQFLEVALVTDMGNAMTSVCASARGIGLQFSGTVAWEKPN